MICPKCGTQISAGKRFCRQCGTPVADENQRQAQAKVPEENDRVTQPVATPAAVKSAICQSCGSEIQAGKKFCNSCEDLLNAALISQQKPRETIPDLQLSQEFAAAGERPPQTQVPPPERVEPPQANVQPPLAAKQERGNRGLLILGVVALVCVLLVAGAIAFWMSSRKAPERVSQPVPASGASAAPAPIAPAPPVTGSGSAIEGPVPTAAPAPIKREEEAKPAPAAMKLPDQWKPLGSGATRLLRVEGDHILGKTTLREEDLRAGNSIVMDVKKRGGKYAGETTLHLVSRSGQACTIRWPMELTTVTPERIEGRSMIPPGTAILDWNSCSYTLPSEWKSFTWVPVN